MPQKIDFRAIGSSVREGVIRYTSVSQISTFDPSQFGGCNRAWWLAKIARLEKPQTFAQDTGVQIHGQIETYLTTGEDILGIVPRAGMRFLPKPGLGLHVEFPFGDEKIVKIFDERRLLLFNVEKGSNDYGDIGVFETFEREVLGPERSKYLIADGNVPILGAIDVVNERDHWLDNDGISHKLENAVEVLDWKSTSDITKYAKTGPELIETVQMIGYAKYASQCYPRTSEIRISHGYFQTRGLPQARKVSTTVPLDIIENRWQLIEQRVKEMKQIARETEIEKVPANLNACSAYRGCAFAANCPRTMRSTIMAAFGATEKTEKHMGLLSQIKSGKPIEPPAAQPAPAKPATVDPTVAAEIERLKAAERGVCTVDGQTLTPENSSKLPSGDVVHIGCKPGVMPPDAPASNPATNATPVPSEALANLTPEVRTAVENHGATAPAMAPETATEKKGRGRPKKSDNATEVHGTTIGEMITATTRELFVDCLIRGRVTVDLSEYVNKMCAELAKACNAPDIRCAPSDSPLAFGKWKGALAAAIRENPPENGTYVLFGVRESEIRQVVVETLEPLCTVVVRGV